MFWQYGAVNPFTLAMLYLRIHNSNHGLLCYELMFYCFSLRAKTGPCYKLSDAARNTLYKLYVLMYLGMDYTIIREKRLELILLHDKINKETYPINKNMVLDDGSVVFRNKLDFDRYVLSNFRCRQRSSQLVEISDLPEVVSSNPAKDEPMLNMNEYLAL